MSKKDKDKKKMAAWKKALITILALLLVLAGSLFAVVWTTLNKINRVNPDTIEYESRTDINNNGSGDNSGNSGNSCDDSDGEYNGYFEDIIIIGYDENGKPIYDLNDADVDPSEDTIKSEDVEWENEELSEEEEKQREKEESNVVNILLIGQDRRPGQGRQRSDSMMIASINKRDKTVTITSILRDSYVQIPGYLDNRVNAAYAYGGMKLLDETIRLNFGIEIDANIEVDFDGFKTIINRLGGVDIALKDYEVNYFNAMGYNYVVGVNHLNGDQALVYARTRHVGRHDIERTQRQRTIVTTVFNMLKDEDPVTLFGLINEFFPYLTTDMSNSDIIYYATLIMGMNLQELQTYRIPADGCFRYETIRGKMVTVPDLPACRRDLRRIIYGS